MFGIYRTQKAIENIFKAESLLASAIENLSQSGQSEKDSFATICKIRDDVEALINGLDPSSVFK